MPRCIYCLRETTCEEPPEHVLPEGVFGVNDFVLCNGEVCGTCNHGVLSLLDKKVAEQFETVRPIFVKRLKKGRRPKHIRGDIDQTIRFERTGDHELRLCVSAATVSEPAGGWPQFSWGLEGMRGEPDVDDPSIYRIHSSIAIDYGVSRAIHKIALGALCKMEGHSAALDPQHNAVREFIRESRGKFEVIHIEGELLRATQGKHPHGQVIKMSFTNVRELGPVWVVAICGLNLAVSLQGTMSQLARALDNSPQLDTVVGFYPDGKTRRIAN